MADAEVTLREAVTADLEAVLDVYRAAGITGDADFTLAEATAQLARFARYPFFRLYVATVDGRVVGTYELVLIDNLAKGGAKTAVVEDVAVDPRYRRGGVGRAMMVHARAVARAQGAYKLALSSNDRRPEAHAFYEALGFRRHGVSFVVAP